MEGAEEMEGKLIRSVFWALVGVFVITIGMTFIPLPIGFFAAGGVLVLLSVALLFLTVKTKVGGLLKKFLLLTGASALGIPIFAILHNVAYMLGIMWFGESAFGNGDEPVLFFMAILVCPIAFLVGVVGTIVLIIKSKQVKQSSQNS